MSRHLLAVSPESTQKMQTYTQELYKFLLTEENYISYSDFLAYSNACAY